MTSTLNGTDSRGDFVRQKGAWSGRMWESARRTRVLR